jgi:hypothetical protein
VPLLLENRSGHGVHWLCLKLEGVNGNRDAIGARICCSVGGSDPPAIDNQRRELPILAGPARVLGIGKVEKIDPSAGIPDRADPPTSPSPNY